MLWPITTRLFVASRLLPGSISLRVRLSTCRNVAALREWCAGRTTNNANPGSAFESRCCRKVVGKVGKRDRRGLQAVDHQQRNAFRIGTDRMKVELFAPHASCRVEHPAKGTSAQSLGPAHNHRYGCGESPPADAGAQPGSLRHVHPEKAIEASTGSRARDPAQQSCGSNLQVGAVHPGDPTHRWGARPPQELPRPAAYTRVSTGRAVHDRQR